MVSNNFYKKNIEDISLSELAKQFGVQLTGVDLKVSGVANIAVADKSELCFLTNKAYLQNLKETNSKACIIEDEFLDRALEINKNIAYLSCQNAYNVLGKILKLFYAEHLPSPTVAKSAIIADSVKLGKNVAIGEGVVLGDNVEIGDNVRILAGSVIEHSVKIGKGSVIGANCVISYANIGENVEILHGAAIGQDGFGFSLDGASFTKVLQLGEVIIEDNVSIGANATIDRGSLENTVIGEGTKIDNIVQIAHNVKIGKNCLIVSQVGIAGSTEIGDYVVLGGQVGVSGHLKIGSYNRFAAQSGVTKNIADNKGDFYGMPAKDKKVWQKEQIALKNITKNYFENE